MDKLKEWSRTSGAFDVYSAPGEALPADHPCVGEYKVEWEYGIQKPVANVNGVTGCAKVLACTCGNQKPGDILRLHICGHVPCRAHWEKNKYTHGWEPLHVLVHLPPPAAESLPGPALAAPPSVPAALPDVPAAVPAPPAAVAANPGVAGPEPTPVPTLPAPPSVEAAVPPAVGPAVPDASGSTPPLPSAAPALAAVAATSNCAAPPMEPDETAVKGIPPSFPTPPGAIPDPPKAASLGYVAAALPARADHRALLPTPRIGGPISAQSTVISQLVALARRIRQPNTTVGYSAFLLMALKRRCRPIIYEGFNPVDLVDVHAHWATVTQCIAGCSVFGVACALQSRSCGRTQFHPISERYPLSSTRHWIAAVRVDGPLEKGRTPVEEFYNHLGMWCLGTVTDNDCGPDTMCQMLDLPQTFEQRLALREELCQYLLAHVQQPWMHDLMLTCVELDEETVVEARRAFQPARSPDDGPGRVGITLVDDSDGDGADGVGAPCAEESAVAAVKPKAPDVDVWRKALFGDESDSSSMDGGAEEGDGVEKLALPTNREPSFDAVGPDVCAAGAEAANGEAPATSSAALAPGFSPQVREALEWATGSKDETVLYALSKDLEPWAIQEQLDKFAAHRAAVAAEKPAQRLPTVLCHLLKDRDIVSREFDKLLRQHEISVPQRDAHRMSYWKVPKEVWAELFSRFHWRGTGVAKSFAPYKIKRWYRSWLEAGKPSHEGIVGGRGHFEKNKAYTQRKRLGCRGRDPVAPIVRQGLYDWFISVRYSIDWCKYNSKLRSCGRQKAMGRFPRSLLRQKLKQLQKEYAKECLLQGVSCKLFRPTANWFRRWEKEYGLSMRKPNRKYKCSKALLAQRLEIFWITVFRIRALCVAACGYDPDMENFDQTPYHANESGSQDVATLAVAGEVVPLIEGHAATRCRWSGNLTTFSDTRRIQRGSLPYCEFMFKHDVKMEQSTLELRLREHIRGRGYGPWVSVATSPSGSYKEHDILNFLERHLPTLDSQSRGGRYRIMFADDFGAHKSDAVRRLCWERGYVLIIHGGGATPVVQTCDTDLNQWARKGYIARETHELLRRFQQGDVVPKLSEETMIDIMVEVLSDPKIHLHAANGYVQTAVAVDLDGAQDVLITREAASFWNELGMRGKINAEIALVRAAVASGHLTWSYEHVRGLILPYPKSKDEDAILAHCRDAPFDEDAEAAWGNAVRANGGDVPGGDGADDDDSNDSGNDTNSDDDGDDDGVLEGEQAAGEAAAAVTETAVAVDNGSPHSSDLPVLSPGSARQLHACHDKLELIKHSIQELDSMGAFSAAHKLRYEMHKEVRKLRTLSKEDPGVARAVQGLSDAATDHASSQLRALEENHRQELSAKRLRLEIDASKAELQRKKDAIKELDEIFDMREEVKTFTPDQLGSGQKFAGGAKGLRNRHELLDRIAHLGTGLSPQQRNDWSWFKHSWDKAMLGEHGGEWPNLLASWMQKVLQDMTQEGGSNAFSLFVHAETQRCLRDVLALQVPGVPSGRSCGE